jgi:hypothetical protein
MAVYVSLQLATAVTLDLIGAVGYVKREFSWQRALGVALMAAGVALVTLFPGRPVGKGLGGQLPGGGGGGGAGGGRPPIGRALTYLYARRPGGGLGPAAAAVAAAAAAAAGGGGVDGVEMGLVGRRG